MRSPAALASQPYALQLQLMQCACSSTRQARIIGQFEQAPAAASRATLRATRERRRLCGADAAWLCAEPTSRGSSSSPGARKPAADGSISGSSSSCARGFVGVGAESQVVRRRCRSRARSDRSCRRALVTPGEACRFECMMCAHTNSYLHPVVEGVQNGPH